jgi:hypothetical protein
VTVNGCERVVRMIDREVGWRSRGATATHVTVESGEVVYAS